MSSTAPSGSSPTYPVYHPNCAGCIPFTPDLSHVVLIKTHNGVLGFPKGKIEKGKTKSQEKDIKKKDESVLAAALRELKEETGLTQNDITLNEHQRVCEDSSKGKPGEICLYPALLKDPAFKFMPEDVEEIAFVGLIPISEAMRNLMSKRQRVLREALALLKANA